MSRSVKLHHQFLRAPVGVTSAHSSSGCFLTFKTPSCLLGYLLPPYRYALETSRYTIQSKKLSIKRPLPRSRQPAYPCQMKAALLLLLRQATFSNRPRSSSRVDSQTLASLRVTPWPIMCTRYSQTSGPDELQSSDLQHRILPQEAPPRLTLQNTVRTDTLSRAVDPERKINISRQGSVEQKSHVCKVGKEKETGWFAVEAVKS